ncbi:PspC domain-containing protein [Aureivirga marina]|uniref:PspC domain-containing protein n=1 Tax=Aureivirga marina TaxID=1182451 RepID=UPI0018CB3AEC|nr:PspC domain-containing protein [Aureivirga marina]
MNKTVNINLGGVFFHIDEEAYQMLKNYLDSIRFSLRNDPEGLEEILNDIEARISELLSEKVKDNRQVVNTTDIEEIISIMGQPEDYSMEEESNDYTTEEDPNNPFNSKRKKYKKKFFRDGEDKFIGGVAAGFAHYVGVEPIWIRILFIISLFIGVGSPILVYLVLWILLPEARTTSEKLQMQGKDINISNIQKTVSENVERISKNVEEFGQKIKKKDLGGFESSVKNNSQKFFDGLGNVMKKILLAIRKIIGIVLLIGSIVMIVSLIVSLFSVNTLNHFGIFQEIFDNNSSFFFENTFPIWMISILIFMLVLIPCIFWLLLSLRIISSNFKGFNLPTILTLVGLWFISLLFVIYSGIEFSSYSVNRGNTNQEERLEFVKNDTIILKALPHEKYGSYSKLSRHSDDQFILENNEQKKYSNQIRIRVKKSNNENSLLRIQKESEGKTFKNAIANTELIDYNFDTNEKELLLNGYFISPTINKRIDEEIDLDVIIPVGTIIYFDDSVKYLLSNVKNVQRIYDRDMINHYFIMTKEGLECLDCPDEVIRNEDYIKTTIDKDNVSIKVNYY